MKTKQFLTTFPLLILLSSFVTAAPLGTAFTYQGQLQQSGAPANGAYDFRFEVYNDPSSGGPLGGTVRLDAVPVANGLFTVGLDFGPGVFTGDARWLEIGVRTNASGSYTTLNPRQPLRPVPYAMFASNSANAAVAVSVVAGAVTSTGLAGDSVTGDKIAPGTITDADVSSLTGDKIVGGDLQALRLKVGQNHALSGQLATIAGGSFNAATAIGDAVGGGGYNQAVGGYSVVGGGEGNIASGYHAVVCGGWQSKATNSYATVAGGSWNTAGGSGAFVGGGGYDGSAVGGNVAAGPATTIGGGLQNTIQDTATYASIGGGVFNNAFSSAATVAGGRANDLSYASEAAVISGGESNRVLEAYAGVIGGGHHNRMDESADGSVIGGGGNNNINSGAPYATIAGGSSNQISTADLGVIGGGQRNYLGGGSLKAVIGGGCSNRVEAGASGVIAGGYANRIATATDCVIGGGEYNSAQGDHAVIGGGENNLSQGDYSVIPGGRDCTVSSDAEYAFAAGRRAKADYRGTFVWADSTDADFSSTRSDEFAIRAAGGVRIQSNVGIHLNPVNQPLITREYDPFTSGKNFGAGRWGVFMEPHTLVLGMPAIGGKTVQIVKYNADSTHTTLMTLDQSGNMTIAGTYSPPSDQAVKQDFAAVNPREVLERLATLPLQSWSYTNNPSARHLGPVAQDFHAAFGLGTDDKHIATVDADGVALAAIQGLNEKLEEVVKQKDAKIAALERELGEVRQLIHQLNHKQTGGAQ